MLRYRLIAALAALALALSITGIYAARESKQVQLRGTLPGFPAPVANAQSLLIGVNTDLQQYDDATLRERLADLASRGVRYVRQEFRWTDMEPARGQMDWTVGDRIFSATQEYRIQVLPVLVTTPVWARAASGSAEDPPTETMPPQAAGDYAEFAHLFARRYDVPMADGKSAILAYQIWDEPNLSAKWGNGLINPRGYLHLLQAARAAIKMVNPSARIVLAGLAPTVEQSDVNLSPELYLRKLYEAGGRDAFDIAATKPYGFDAPPDDRRVDASVMNFSRAILLREEMAAHGDANKPIWFTQWGWNAQLPDWQGQPSLWGSVSEQQQAGYTAQAIQRTANEWPWASAMFLSTLQPAVAPTDPLWGFSLLDQTGRPRPVYDALIRALPVAAGAPRAQWAVVGYGNSGQTDTATTQPVYSPNPDATYSEGWRFSELGADIPQRADARVTFHFGGDALAMIVRRGDYRAYMFITVDGKPANLLPVEERGSYLILTSPDDLPHIDTIAVADNLGPGEHTADIAIDRGWNQWALIGWSSRAAPSAAVTLANAVVPAGVAVLLLSLLGLVVSLPRVRWGDLLRRIRLQVRVSPWQAVATALIVWLTASLTWAQDAANAYRNLGTPVNLVLTGVVSGIAFWSPVFVLSLIALLVLFVLVLLRLDIGLMLLAFFIPFYLIPQRLFAKSFSMVELLIIMCTVSWAVGRLGELRQTLRTAKNAGQRFHLGSALRSALAQATLLDWSILALVIVAAISTMQADYKVEALRELRLVIVEPAILFMLIRTQKMPADAVWRIVDGFVLGAVAIAVIGLFNYARGDVFPAELGFPRIRSVYGSPNNDALYLGRIFPLLLAMTLFGRWPLQDKALTTGRRRLALAGMPLAKIITSRRLLYTLSLLPVALALLLSASRGALLLGVPAAIVVVCFLGGGRWRIVAVAMVACVVLALLVIVSGVAEPLLVHTRFENAFDLTHGTGFFRINLWQSAIAMFRDHPILGVGPDNFLYAYRGHYILPAAWQEPDLSHPHNIILDFATRLGMLGLLVAVGLAAGLWGAIRRALNQPDVIMFRPMVIGIAGLLADMVAHGMVDHSLFLLDLSSAFMLSCALLAQIHRQGSAKEAQTLTKL
ncbi:MAG: O-antigen ligase family protein [Chloroflexi bacterium]|nr:O-antigen ligase family protein [Chloroflexota bacterium]MCL5275813.1 O-antigen ligase family protein [Chloroflexota bacterium]